MISISDANLRKFLGPPDWCLKRSVRLFYQHVLSSFLVNLLEPELFFLILAHPLYKM
jgi:hypothetical protein